MPSPAERTKVRNRFVRIHPIDIPILATIYACRLFCTNSQRSRPKTMGRNLTTKIRQRLPSPPHLFTLCVYLPLFHHSFLGKHAHTRFSFLSSMWLVCLPDLLFVVSQAIASQNIYYIGDICM